MEWMILPLKRYADFSGRSRRKEYWMFFLFQFLVQIVMAILFLAIFFIGMIDLDSTVSSTAGLILLAAAIGIYFIFWVAMLVPNMAVVVRRLHDQDIPGLVGILLYIATIILTFPGLVILVLMCLEGKKGDNQYGKDPKMNENIGAVFQ